MITQAIITQAVRNYMRRERYSQSAMAALLETSQTSISRKLLNESRWSMEDLDRLTVLGVIKPLTALDVTDWDSQ